MTVLAAPAATECGGSGGTGGTGGSSGAPGCGANLLPLPSDPSIGGPWPVGVRTVTIGRLTAELWYPAQPGSEVGRPVATYDLRDWLPDSERPKVPDAESPAISATPPTYRDLPIDSGHGPYPVVIFMHGTGSLRGASMNTNVHWASRGFVVLAADHPGMYMTDMLKWACFQIPGVQDLNGDMDAEIAALSNPSGGLAFLAGRIDMTRLGISGHSQGAWTIARMSTKPNVQVVMPLANTTPVSPSPSLKSVMIVSGTADLVIPYYPGGFGLANFLSPGNDTDAYNFSPGPPEVRKRLVGIQGGGHLVVTDLCQTNQFGRNMIEVAVMYGVCGLGILPAVFDCGTIDRLAGTKIVNDVTTAALEETLHCQDRSSQIANIRQRYPLVNDFHEAK